MSNRYQELKRQPYLGLLQECARSGMSKRKWCAQAGVKYSTLMRWQGLLRDELAGEILSREEIVLIWIQKPSEEALVSKSKSVCGADGATGVGISPKKEKSEFICPENPSDYLASIVKELV